MITYYKLFDLINRKDINKTELRNGARISNGTMNKLTHNKNVETASIGRICEYLKVQPGDILEYEFEAKPKKVKKQ